MFPSTVLLCIKACLVACFCSLWWVYILRYSLQLVEPASQAAASSSFDYMLAIIVLQDINTGRHIRQERKLKHGPQLPPLAIKQPRIADCSSRSNKTPCYFPSFFVCSSRWSSKPYLLMLLEGDKSCSNSQRLLLCLQKSTKKSSRGSQIGVSKERSVSTTPLLRTSTFRCLHSMRSCVLF